MSKEANRSNKLGPFNPIALRTANLFGVLAVLSANRVKSKPLLGRAILVREANRSNKLSPFNRIALRTANLFGVLDVLSANRVKSKTPIGKNYIGQGSKQV